MATEQELAVQQEEAAAAKARADGAREGRKFIQWLLRHDIVWVHCAENTSAMDAYLKANQLEFSFVNCVAAYNALTKAGHKFVLDRVEAPALPAPAPEEEPPLPEVPGMGEPQIYTVADVKKMPPDRYKKLYGTSSCPNLPFRARVDEILRRGK